MDAARLVDAARRALAEGDAQRRYERLGALGDLLRVTQDEAERVAAFLVETALTSRHPDAREEALHSLAEAGHVLPYQVVEPLANQVHRLRGAELEYVLSILADTLDEAARPVLDRYVDHHDRNISETAVAGLKTLDHANG